MPETLSSLAEGIRRCTACPLWKKRLLAVPGDGPANASILFIGEAPGAEEDRLGLPFMGRSGKFLDELFKVAEIERKDVFITGSCKCHPPLNRTPTSLELKTCKSLWLDGQIATMKPKLIILLGSVALFSVLGMKEVSKFHGTVIEKENRKYFVTYHPAAGMRFPNIRTSMKEDFTILKRLKN